MAGTLIIETGAWELIASPSNAVSEGTHAFGSPRPGP